MAVHNANYVGGDVVTGSNDVHQLVFRPRAAMDPYRTGVPGVYLCSAATPPGAGAHGMCGYNARRSPPCGGSGAARSRPGKALWPAPRSVHVAPKSDEL